MTDDTSVRMQWSDVDEPSLDIVKAAASIRDERPTDLPVLADYVDPDALDALLSGDPGGSLSLSFSYEAVDVVIEDGEFIEIRF